MEFDFPTCTGALISP